MVYNSLERKILISIRLVESLDAVYHDNLESCTIVAVTIKPNQPGVS